MKVQSIEGAKERKIKPMKQPVKALRSTLLDKSGRTEEPMNKDTRSKLIQPTVTKNEHKNNTRQSICTSLLETGNVQSFIDLFYISHKCLPNLMEKRNYFGEVIHLPQEYQFRYLRLAAEDESSLQFYIDFSASLTKAEVHCDSTREQKDAAMSEYNSIAYNYEDQGDFITASYFYQKVIDLALSAKNKHFQLGALLGLGKCHDQSKKKDKAIEILEDAFDNASTLEDKEEREQMVKEIGKQLIEIYIGKAEELVKFDLEAALKAYEAGLAIAERAGERENQARISHKIGQLYYLEGEFNKSVNYQEQYLEKLKQAIEDQLVKENEQGVDKKDAQTTLRSKQMEAHASLAKCYLKLKVIDKAEIHLNEYHRMAKEAKAQNSLADSSYYLAKLFEEKGEKDKAILYYQSYFEAAKSQKPDRKDRKLVDKARVTYAIAKANKNMDKYISLFEDDQSLKNVLDWKIKRVLK